MHEYFHDGFLTVSTPDGHDLGQIGDSGVFDTLGESIFTVDHTGLIDQVLNSSGHSEAMIFGDHISTADGGIAHVEHDPFGGVSIHDDLHPSDWVSINHSGNEDVLSNADNQIIANVRANFGS